MTHKARVLAGIGAVLIMCGIAGCIRPSRTAPSRAACPAPRSHTQDWGIVHESALVVFRLPPAFIERSRETGARAWALHGDFQQYILAGFIESSAGSGARGRAHHRDRARFTASARHSLRGLAARRYPRV